MILIKKVLYAKTPISVPGQLKGNIVYFWRQMYFSAVPPFARPIPSVRP